MPQLPAEEERARGQPRIGTDEWVAEVERRRERSPLRRALEAVPPPARLFLPVAAASTLPFLTSSEYVVRVGVDTLVFVLLALGLNIVVGYAGLLDLGYVAFFGFGAYLYALLSSGHFDIHWPAAAVIPLVVASSALLGLLLGLPSRRLLGDYLAIVTLFFGQLFLTITNNANRITPPWRDEPVDLTGGPNGIVNIDPLAFFGLRIDTVVRHYWFALGVAALVIVGLVFLSASRTGRAWRALREDPLAAEVMGMPVNRLKLLAFMFGAGTAGLTGTIFASLQANVFPANFNVTLLITIYAMVILGGSGSIAGVAIGAVVINLMFEVLTNPGEARYVFYLGVLALVLAAVRRWRDRAAVLAGTAIFGLAVHALAGAVWPRGVAGQLREGGALGGLLESWVLLPTRPATLGNVGFVLLVLAALALVTLRGWPRLALLVPTLYLAVFVWENRLVAEPSITRFILIGALLVVLMNLRPQGLLGARRVEIV